MRRFPLTGNHCKLELSAGPLRFSDHILDAALRGMPDAEVASVEWGYDERLVDLHQALIGRPELLRPAGGRRPDGASGGHHRDSRRQLARGRAGHREARAGGGACGPGSRT